MNLMTVGQVQIGLHELGHGCMGFKMDGHLRGGRNVLIWV